MEWYWFIIPIGGILAILLIYFFYYYRSSVLSVVLGDSSPTLESGSTNFARVQSTKSEAMWIPSKGIANKVKYSIEANGHDARIVLAGKNGYYVYTRPQNSKTRYTQPLRARQTGDVVVVTLPSKSSEKEVAPKEIEIKHAKILKRK